MRAARNSRLFLASTDSSAGSAQRVRGHSEGFGHFLSGAFRASGGLQLERSFVFRGIGQQRIDAAIDFFGRELLALLLRGAALTVEQLEHGLGVFRAPARVLVEQREHELVDFSRDPTARSDAAGRRRVLHQVAERRL